MKNFENYQSLIILLSTGMGEIVLICRDFWPDTQATSQLFSDLIHSLTEKGHDISVLCGHPLTSEHKPDATHPFEKIKIIRIGPKNPSKKNISCRLYNYIAFLLHLGKYIPKYRTRKVIALTAPPFLPIWIYILQKLFRFSYDLFLLDLYPEILIGLEIFKPNALVVKIWKSLNRKAFHRAERIFVIGRDMEKVIKTSYGLDETTHYFPHWGQINGKLITFEDSHLTNELNLQSKFVVQYSGNMGMLHDMDSFVLVAKALIGYENIHFLFLGDGKRRERAKKLSAQIKNITWLPPQPKTDLSETLAACHIGLISLRENMLGYAVPSKLYGILASARAVIAMVPKGSEVEQVVTESNCGIITSNIDDTVSAILELYYNRKKLAQLATNGHREFLKKYTLNKAVSRYEQFYI
ncbi:MAG: glycosyltransferase family 4 protein [Puniceicoccales bacterium]|jgi:glycosyltransferase involved in cell wall biosynthesis|nr:glycosyltransferase family 4 protein [Puniceicoccales bacterium]